MHPFEQYLTALAESRASGATLPETSGYPALANLLNTHGAKLKPKVTVLIQLANSGAGIPDGGFFTPDQLKGTPEDAPLRGLNPSRGAVEVKALDSELATIAATKQVRDYVNHYGQVLLTNYPAFHLLWRDPAGNQHDGECFVLAQGVSDFWQLAAQPRKAAEQYGERLADYLQRIMLHAAPLDNPRDLAFFLASYAREARYRVEHAPLDALASLRTSLETALGLKVETERGLHFFRSTLVQTLFYGVFSAWVLWHRERPGRIDVFNWKTAAFNLRLPVLRKLFHELTDPAHVHVLDVSEPLDWASSVLDRVQRPAFFRHFAEEHAVQYFYEPFLEAFDPQLREDFGVWYTPEEIVRYMVARVDRTLREQFGRSAGLADPDVVVLDPCCGTGAFLVETLHTIHRYHAEEEGLGDLAAFEAKKAARERLFGFEVLPAPYVVAHLQLGLLLQKLGAPLDENTGERASVYLTNALTGWSPTRDPKQLVLQELQAEREAANKVKQEQRILVILGNPPYDGFAGLAMAEERDLGGAYREVHTPGCPAPQGQGLNDLYVRFYRMAERQIVEKTGEGIVCYISNYSWLDGLSHPGMRERFLEAFDAITIDCLNGDKFKTGKLTPEGQPDPSVFSTEANREGIQVGTAIAMLVRRPLSRQTNDRLDTGKKAKKRPGGSAQKALLRFRQFWGKQKRKELLESLNRDDGQSYRGLVPVSKLGLAFVPTVVGRGYLDWPKVPDLLPKSFPGVKTSRDAALVDFDLTNLQKRMSAYFDPTIPDEQITRSSPAPITNTQRFKARSIRKELIRRGISTAHFVRYNYRPLDVRWLCWEGDTKLLDEKRSEFFFQLFSTNLFLEARQRQSKEDFDRGYVTRVLADNFGNGLSSFFPLYLRPEDEGFPSGLFANQHTAEIKPNVSSVAAAYLTKLGSAAEALFFHIVAILHAPTYRTEHSGGLRQDWPRVPLPATREALEASAALGRQIAALLDPETPVPGVTIGGIRSELKEIATLKGQDLHVKAGWGSAGKGGIVMPGKGRITAREVQITDIRPKDTHAPSSPNLDIWLNDATCWRNVPEGVWDYTLGGYQVLKKWLSYREASLLGRALTSDEAREFTHIARRIAALRLLEPQLDQNYALIKSATTNLAST